MKSKPLGYESQPLAAIDIGTNTLRLLIAAVLFDSEKSSYTIKKMYSDRTVTRLGEGISKTRLLEKDAINRSIDTLKNYREIISRHNVYKTSAVATSALRDAKNNADFLKRAKNITGIDIKIISGEEEAKKTASGMLIDITLPETALMVDIGGGSTEFIFAKEKKPALIRSLNLGVVYLAEKYMKNDPPSKKDLEYMNVHISKEIGTIVKPFSELITQNSKLKTVFIGTAGTVTTLAAIKQGLKRFEHSKVHNTKISIEEVKNIFSKISTITAKERIKYHPFDPSRLDIIVPGTLILLKLMETFAFKEILVSNYGLREGVLLELYEKYLKDTPA